MAAPLPIDEPVEDYDFDPLREFHGVWNTRLVERYRSTLDRLFPRYECLDGKLVVSPAERSSNGYGAAQLAIIMNDAAKAAGFLVYGTLNIAFNPERWIQPDMNVLRRVPEDEEESLWVPARDCLMPVEFISRSSERRDRIDKPALCAEGGIPYFMQVKIIRKLRSVEVTLLQLSKDGQHSTIAHAVAGQTFETHEPFDLSFDPARLLEP
jgi:hypothetical protein